VRLTKFQQDVLDAIAAGCTYHESIIQWLRNEGRQKVDTGRLLDALAKLREAGRVVTSMAGRNTVKE
jgi:DNA-binding PadR family transcriptional regulator